MTSKQAMLAALLALLCVAPLSGCTKYLDAARYRREMQSPYTERQVWAVAPLRNESGSRFADGVALADDLTHQFTMVDGIDVLPVNRVLAAMQALKMPAITSKEQALALRDALGVDGLVVGSLTAWDPYDPPKIGIALELYVDPVHPSRSFDSRELTWAATEGGAVPSRPYQQNDQPVSTVSGYYDAADPGVRDAMVSYGRDRGKDDGKLKHQARLYQISMDLYSEFVSHLACTRLLAAERTRLPAAPAGGKTKQAGRTTQASP